MTPRTKNAPVLPEGWAERAVATFPGGGEDVIVGLSLLTGPDGDEHSTWRYQGGRLEVSEGLAPDVAVTLQISYSDAAAVLSGDAEPAVLFMQGKLKSTGDNGVLLRLLEAASADAFGEWRSRSAN